jgi:hypothetical protein
MNRIFFKPIVWALLALSMLLNGCGGGGGGGSSNASILIASGKFIDAPVEGMKFLSGAQTGLTGANGEFSYEVGKSVTFSVGGVVVGSAPGAAVITPMDLVKAALPGTSVTVDSPSVVQIAQFLLTSSSLTPTGMKIDPAVTAACFNQNIDLPTAAAANFATLINQIAKNSGNRNVTGAADALGHLAASISAIAAGGKIVLPDVRITGGGANLPAVNTGPTYTISGKVTASNGAGLAGVMLSSTSTPVTLATIGLTAIQATDSNGNYSFQLRKDGSYAINIYHAGKTFDPPSRTVVVNGANVSGQNFMAVN